MAAIYSGPNGENCQGKGAFCHREGRATDLKKFARELFGVFLLFCALLLLVGLLSYDASDPSLNHIQSGASQAHNMAGLFGAYTAGFLDDIFGLGALIWPCIFASLGYVYLSARINLHWWRWTGFFLLTVCLMVMASSLDLHIGDLGGGGVIGTTLQTYSARFLSPFGSFLLWMFVFFAGLQLSVNFSCVSVCQRVWLHAKKRWHDFKQREHGSRQERAQKLGNALEAMKAFCQTPLAHCQKLLARLPKAPAGKASAPNSAMQPHFGASRQMPDLRMPDDDDPFAACQMMRPDPLQNADIEGCAPTVGRAQVIEDKPLEQIDRPVLPTPGGQLNLPAAEPSNDAPLATAPLVAPRELKEETLPDLPEPLAPEVVIDERPEVEAHKPPLKIFEDKREPELPSPELLEPPAPIAPVTPEDLGAKGRALMGCFNDFDITGELARITPGPVVTMFEVRPAPGIRVSKIANLSDDLSLALKAMAVRIQAPIPGSDTVGIEIPNERREMVNFRELVESADFARSAAPLTMILGKDIAGHPFMADLAKMPHMLVAGATGAGKSVCLNSILISMLYRHPPSRLRLLLVDPKRIEMAVYSDLPHLVHPVVTEMDDAKNALAWAVEEMESRFKIFMRLGVRNIGAYHDKLASFGGYPPDGLEDLQAMPYMVIVIDELADLMLTAAREVEPKIQRLSQLARAAGIHMILATQRPSVDVVTGLIKAQFPCRISFQVSSKHDSRTILDQVGAEHLLGRGDMLFKPPGGRLIRLHGPYLSDEEVHAVVTHWKTQLPPDYQVDFSQWTGESANPTNPVGGDAANDVLYKDARNFVLEQGRASISLLQRHLKIGFNRAARLMEQFEREGLIGPADGSKPRTVIR